MAEEEICFWTDVEGATQLCAVPEPVGWVPLHETGIAYTETLEPGVTRTDSTIAGTNVAYFNYTKLWELSFDPSGTPDGYYWIRATFNNFSSGGNSRFTWINEAGLRQGSQVNELTPPVTDFSPNPVVAAVFNHQEFGPGSAAIGFDPSGSAAGSDMTFDILVEIWVGEGLPPGQTDPIPPEEF